VSAEATAPGRILLVEDEAIVARDLERSLVRLGYAIVGVEARGEDAIARVERDPPDLVLMDIRLRGAIDGVTAATEIWRRFGVPSVFLTAYADDETVNRALAAGSFGYLLKPFDVRELRATIEIAMRRSREGRAARAREARLYELLTLLGDAVAKVEEDGRFSRLNAAAERLLGRTEAEIVAAGLTAAEMVGEGAEEATLRPPFGDEVRVRICRLPVAGAAGPAELLVFHDPKSDFDRDRRILRREVAAQLQHLISGVVHGVGNPLFVLSSHLDLMALDVGAAPADGAILEQLRRQVDRIRALLVYLTELAGADGGAARRVAVGRLIADAVAEAAASASARGVGIEIEDLSSATEAEINPDAFRSACAQLLANAIEFSPSPGTIRVRLRHAAAKSEGLLCEFENDGPPIAAEDLDRLFQPFFSRRRQGSGLGLAIVRRVADDHGGRAFVENLERGGVRFTMALPLRRKAP
jgi:signal transduction histidine kinase